MFPIKDIFSTTVFTPERYDSSTSFYRSFHRRRHSTTIEGLKIYEITFPQCCRFLLLLPFHFHPRISSPDGIFVRSSEGKKERRYLAMSMKVEETFSEAAALLIYSLRRRRRRELVELIPEDFCLESRSRREEQMLRSQNNGFLEVRDFYCCSWINPRNAVHTHARAVSSLGS